VNYRDSNSACALGGWYHTLITHHLRHSKREVPQHLLILKDETRLGAVLVTASIVIWPTGGSKITFLALQSVLCHCLLASDLAVQTACMYCWVFEKARVEIHSSLCGIYADACFLGRNCGVALIFTVRRTDWSTCSPQCPWLRQPGPGSMYLASRKVKFHSAQRQCSGIAFWKYCLRITVRVPADVTENCDIIWP